MEKSVKQRTGTDRLIRLYEFLSCREDSDILELVDSGTFNDVIRGSAGLAARKAGIDNDKGSFETADEMTLFREDNREGNGRSGSKCAR